MDEAEPITAAPLAAATTDDDGATFRPSARYRRSGTATYTAGSPRAHRGSAESGVAGHRPVSEGFSEAEER